MPRNRVTYNNQSLFVLPISGEQQVGSIYYLPNYKILKKLEKIQNINYSIQQNRSNSVGFGQKYNIFRGLSFSPDTKLNFSYISDGITNENKLNFDVGNFKYNFNGNMFSGLCTNNPNLNKRDFYLAISKNEQDINSYYIIDNNHVYPNSISNIIDKDSPNYELIHFQDCYLNEYSFSLNVGGLPTVNQSYLCNNLIFYTSGSGINYTKLNTISGTNDIQNEQIIVPKSLKYNQSSISGQNILVPAKANISFYTNNNSISFYEDTFKSFDFNLSFNRNIIKSINYRFPLIKPLTFPINGKLNLSIIVNKTLSGSFFDSLKNDQDYNIVVNFLENQKGVENTKFTFSGCKFNDINYDSSIGSNKTANISFIFDLDPEFSQRGLFVSGNGLKYQNTLI